MVLCQVLAEALVTIWVPTLMGLPLVAHTPLQLISTI